MNQTPFFPLHEKLGAKIVDFAGWQMPIQYTTITQEHNAVRSACGLFDISHMGQVFVWGEDAEAYLQNLVTNDVRKATAGKGIYAHLLNDQGCVIDDIFIYRIEPDKFLVVINASRRDVDINWMRDHKAGYNAIITEAPYAAGLALQGPNAVKLLEKFSPQVSSLKRFEVADLPFNDVTSLVARTGYTGEDGFELFAPAGHLLQIWDSLFSVGKNFGMLPCGLGARDTLRTEVAYPLYGHELDENHTPFEAGLDWVVKLEKGKFIGRDALMRQKNEGLKAKLYGFKVNAGGVARPGGIIRHQGKDVGVVTSGTFSPTLNQAIGMTFLPIDLLKEGIELTIRQGTRELQAVTTKLPFYKK